MMPEPTINEDQWIAAQHAQVLQYLEREQRTHGGVAEEPDWCVIPYVAVWAIRSLRSSDTVGWWAISGDLPTDYVSAHDCVDSRTAVRAICTRWQQASIDMAAGRANPHFQIGTPADWPSLAPLLASRVALLQDWADDDTVWA